MADTAETTAGAGVGAGGVVPASGTEPGAADGAGTRSAEKVTMRVWRGDAEGGEFTDYEMPAVEGEVVLDVIHRIQADPRRTWRAGGTARPASAGRARRRSTGCRG